MGESYICLATAQLLARWCWSVCNLALAAGCLCRWMGLMPACLVVVSCADVGDACSTAQQCRHALHRQWRRSRAASTRLQLQQHRTDTLEISA
jgi:hypothetical protein